MVINKGEGGIFAIKNVDKNIYIIFKKYLTDWR